ncbi:hypothetical protein NT6N_28430 [Oceaniferula spumae]|uniref:Histidine kinase domain-containing protein n=1 Tax=Oceaniferula spumae TaxID=2979115 RepID=A0AAT9FPA5_9BACT
MRHCLIFLLIISASLAAMAQDIQLERKSFPHSPDDVEHSAKRYTEKSLIPATSVAALERQEKWLREQLKKFPPPETQTSPPQRQFGYLSERHPTGSGDKPMEEWIHIQLHDQHSLRIEGIALIPACYPELSIDKNYGFPRRFKIDVYSAKEPEKAITVVDWTQQDFPDPGLSPVNFTFPSMGVQRVKITVTKGARDGDTQFFALDELMIFRAGNNMILPSARSITASSSTETAPFWSLQYLTDHKQHLGKFLHAPQAVPDFIQYFDQVTTQNPPSQILIDLGSPQSIGRVELYAASIPDTPVPTVAMPVNYQIDLLNDLNSNRVVASVSHNGAPIHKMRSHPLSSEEGRYLRVTINRLPRHRGRPVLALGEIRVIGDEGYNQVNIAKGKSISLTNIPGEESASLLVDGLTNGREIVPEKQYIAELAKRQIVEDALDNIQNQLIIARATRSERYWTIGITTTTLALFCIILGVLHLKSSRSKAVREVQQQIAADLHDDISGNLGTISMISSRLQSQTDPELTQEKLREIRHLSQESYISVKEIIWLTETGIILISDILEQIKRTAQSILSECRVQYKFPENFQNSVVPLKARRNITLLVKEVLYNCAKYAKATTMVIQAEISDKQLRISMQDDGCGFDPTSITDANSDSGRGLSNMERRARLLGAELSIHSAPGEGTRITLTAPINPK